MSEQLIHAARDLVGRILQKNPKRRHHCAEVAARAQALAAPRCRNRRPVPWSPRRGCMTSATGPCCGTAGFTRSGAVPAPGRLARARVRSCRASFR